MVYAKCPAQGLPDCRHLVTVSFLPRVNRVITSLPDVTRGPLFCGNGNQPTSSYFVADMWVFHLSVLYLPSKGMDV